MANPENKPAQVTVHPDTEGDISRHAAESVNSVKNADYQRNEAILTQELIRAKPAAAQGALDQLRITENFEYANLDEKGAKKATDEISKETAHIPENAQLMTAESITHHALLATDPSLKEVREKMQKLMGEDTDKSATLELTAANPQAARDAIRQLEIMRDPDSTHLAAIKEIQGDLRQLGQSLSDNTTHIQNHDGSLASSKNTSAPAKQKSGPDQQHL